MKKVIPAILLLFVFAKSLVLQTLEQRIQVVENNVSNYSIVLQLALDRGSALIGNATSRIHFDPNVISFPQSPRKIIDYSFYHFFDNKYRMSVTQPNTGIVSINIVNLDGSAALLSEEFVPVAKLNFKTIKALEPKVLTRGLQQFFIPSSSSKLKIGSVSISELSEIFIPEIVFPYDTEILNEKDVTLKWKTIDKAIKYNVQISDDPTFRLLEYSLDNITENRLSVKGLKEDILYFWRVRSYTEEGSSHFSRKSSFSIKLSEPSDLNSTPYNGQSVQLNWENNSLAASFIVIEKKLKGSEPGKYTIVDTINAKRNSYIDVFVEDNKSYIYRVRAIGNHTTSSYSDSSEVSLLIKSSASKLEVPKEFKLQQNYPNPFNPQTTIDYSVKEDSHITITVYSMLGEKVTTLVDKPQNAGKYDVVWNAANYPSGIYVYVMTAKSNISNNVFKNVKKMVLLK